MGTEEVPLFLEMQTEYTKIEEAWVMHTGVLRKDPRSSRGSILDPNDYEPIHSTSPKY